MPADDARLQLYFLGPPRLVLDGAALVTDRRKAVALLATLAVGKKPASRAALAALLWPEYDSERAYAYLRRALWELNHTLGEGWLQAGRDEISLGEASGIWVDAIAFQELSASCASGSPGEQVEALEQAAALYQGDFMAGFALPDAPQFEEWQLVVAEGLRRKASDVLERLSRGYEERSQLEQAVQAARRWLALDTLHEPAHRRLMELYARLGQATAAMRQYEQCRQLLEKEMGLTPDPETVALAEQIRRGGLAPAPRPAPLQREGIPVGAAPEKYTLPAQLTPFVGRRAELEEIGRLLADPACRLLTLMGPGGIGKTRLAIQAGLELGERFSGGACFVPLVGLRSAESILPAVGQALGLTFDADRDVFQQVCQFLSWRQILLILDNYEHLIGDESATLPGELASAGAGVKVLVTSRQSLNVQGEQLYQVGGMRLPDDAQAAASPQDLENYSAVRLFLQSARRQRPDFELDGSNSSTVLALCRLLQGMPLAIELAAGWVGMLSPAEILKELQASLDFLETSRRDVPARQRSLRAVFESSWNLLGRREAELFNAFSIFKNGFTRQAAQAVTGASLRELAALDQKSLLQRQSNGRYAIHPLLGEYAAERLRQDQAAWQRAGGRHCEYFVDFVSEAAGRMRGHDQRAAFAAVQGDQVNILAAWDWAIEHHQFELVDKAVFGLFLYFNLGAYRPDQDAILARTIQALELSPQPGELKNLLLVKLLTLRAGASYEFSSNWTAELLQRARELVRRAGGERQIGFFYSLLAMNYAQRVDREEGLEMLHASLELHRQAGDDWSTALALRMLGGIHRFSGQRNEAVRAYTEAVELLRRLGDRVNLAYALIEFGWCSRQLLDEARLADRYFAEGLALAESLGQKAITANVHWILAELSGEQGDFEAAYLHYGQSEIIFRDMGMLPSEASMASWQSIFTARQGDYERARTLRLHSLAISEQYGDVNGILWSKWELGEIERLEGNYAEARRLAEESLKITEDNRGHISFLPFYYRGLGQVALAEGDFAEARGLLERSLAEARHSQHNWATSYALSLLGQVEIAQGELRAAQDHLREGLMLAVEMQNPGLVQVALAAQAALQAAQGQHANALELAAFIQHHRATWREIREQVGQILAASANQLSPEEAAAVRQKGEQASLGELLERYNF